MRGERDGLSGPFATADRGRASPGEALEGSHEPKAMRGERVGNRDPPPPQPAGEQPQLR
jgi:hypothetical protein